MKCPKCKTENGYVRLSTAQWVCRKCGKISKLKLTETVPPQKEVAIEDQTKTRQPK